MPVAAAERGKQVIVSMNGKRFSVADNDFSKCGIKFISIHPTIVCKNDTPSSIE